MAIVETGQRKFEQPLREHRRASEKEFSRLIDLFEGERDMRGDYFAEFGSKGPVDSRVLIFKSPLDIRGFIALTRRGFRTINPHGPELSDFRAALETEGQEFCGFEYDPQTGHELIRILKQPHSQAIEFRNPTVLQPSDEDLIRDVIDNSREAELNRLMNLMEEAAGQEALARKIAWELIRENPSLAPDTNESPTDANADAK